jgi:hypothetical protein
MNSLRLQGPNRAQACDLAVLLISTRYGGACLGSFQLVVVYLLLFSAKNVGSPHLRIRAGRAGMAASCISPEAVRAGILRAARIGLFPEWECAADADVLNPYDE